MDLTELFGPDTLTSKFVFQHEHVDSRLKTSFFTIYLFLQTLTLLLLFITQIRGLPKTNG